MRVSRRQAIALTASLIASPFVLRAKESEAATSIRWLGGPKRVATEGFGGDQRIATLTNGSFIITWLEYIPAEDSSRGRFRAFDPSGAPLSPPKIVLGVGVDSLHPVATAAGRSQILGMYRPPGYFPSVMSRPVASDFAFEPLHRIDSPPAYSAFDVLPMAACQLVTGPTMAIWTSYQAYEGVLCSQTGIVRSRFTLPRGGAPIAMAALANGGAVYGYRESDSTTVSLFAQRLTSSGQLAGPPLLLKRKPFPVGVGLVGFGSLANGGFIVAWYDWGNSNEYLCWKLVSSAGVASARFFSRNGDQFTEQRPTLARDTNGNIVVASVCEQGTENHTLAIRIIAPNGNLIAGPVLLPTSPQPYFVRGIARLRAGVFAVLYTAGNSVYFRFVQVR